MADATDSVMMLPPVLVTGGLVLGFTLTEWVKLATLLYVLVGIVCSIKRAFFPAQTTIINDKENNNE